MFPKNSGTPKSSILIGFSIINHPYWGTPIFGNTHIELTTHTLIGLKKTCMDVHGFGVQPLMNIWEVFGTLI